MGDVEIEKDRICVKQRIGLFGGIAFVVGSIIGSGIFISPRGALAYSGSVGLSLIIWAGCGLLATTLAMVYAQMGVLMPKSGGDYTYIRIVIGDLPAFLVTWIQTTIMQPGSRTVLSLVFADYLCAPIFGGCGPPNSVRKTIAAAELIFLAGTNILSVRFATAMQGLFTSLKVLALVIISVGGVVFLAQGQTDNFKNTFEGSTNDVSTISLAIYQCMWAYSGFNSLNEISEEIIQPRKNIPRVIILSLTLVTVTYIATNVSYFTLLTKSEFLSVPAVAFAWGNRALGSAAIIIPISVMCSVHGAANGGIFADGRTRFAASRAGHLPEVLSFLHHRTRIPVASLILNNLCSLILLVPGDIAELINLISFMYMVIIFFTVISLLKLKYTRRKSKIETEAFSIPVAIPMLALLITIFMIISPFLSDPKIEFLYGIAYVVAGVLMYVPFVYFNWKIPGFDQVTTFIQLILEVCPTVLEDDITVPEEPLDKSSDEKL